MSSPEKRSAAVSPLLARLVLIISALVTGALYALPIGRTLGYPFVLLSTLAHELGHGIAALAIGGRFSSFELYPDASGVALTAATSPLGHAFVAAGGLVGPSLAALVFFVMGKTPLRARLCLGATGLALGLALIFVVRNTFGWVFIAGLMASCLFLAWSASAWLSQLVLVFSATQLALSVYSRADYLFTPVAHTRDGLLPSDVALISATLLLPYWFWGALCGATSLTVLAFGLRYYWRAPAV